MTHVKLPPLTKAQLRRLRRFQPLSPDERLKALGDANNDFLRRHPDIMSWGPTFSEAMRAYRDAKHKWLEIEVVRDKRGKVHGRVVEVPWRLQDS